MKKYFLKVRYLIEYCIFLVVITGLRLLSLDQAADLCAFICKKIGPYLKVTNIAKKNLRMAYGDTIDIPQTIDDLWDNFGRFIGEFAHLHLLSQDALRRRVEITGLEHIERFKARQEPFILFTGHLANWESIICLAPIFYPEFAIIYRKANNYFIDALIKKWRQIDGVTFIEKGIGGSRAIVSAVKARKSIAMLVDQKMNDGISVPFFGSPAMTAPAIAKFAKQFGYQIVPMQIIRKGRSSYFKIKLFPPMEVSELSDMEIMSKINAILEGWIREHPEQWFWFHNRWGK